jgi:hypothetical protein
VPFCKFVHLKPRHPARATRGHALLIVLGLLGVSIVLASGLYLYSTGNAKQNARNSDYYTALGAAEAATEKVLSEVTSDFHDYGKGYVLGRLSQYRQDVPNTTEASEWANFDFIDLSGASNRNEVDLNSIAGFAPLSGQYGPLRAFKDQVRILSNARWKKSLSGAVGSVYQDVELTSIPIFQYAVFYNVLLEFTPLPPMTVTGPVHCNTNIYLNPGGVLTFQSDITSSLNIIEGPNPDGIPALGGSIVYNGKHDSGVSTLNLPIGTNNSPAAVHQVLEMPPAGEDPLSSLGLQRFYNKADLLILVSNTTVVAKSGLWNNFATRITNTELATFFSTNTAFYNKREGKMVRNLQIDVAKLVSWNTNNSTFHSIYSRDVALIYVADCRTIASGDESGVRLINGTNLPPKGLTVATTSPVYIQGDFNVPASARGTTNTSGTLPASIAGDAITILSTNWSDANAANSSTVLSSRLAGNTTVNAAFLAGIVQTTAGSDSGGVENFPRFLEDWGSGAGTKVFTYNGSMVCMFYSQVATGLWGGIGDPPGIYNPPVRNWSLDQNFQYYNKLPPGTPALMVLVRANWRTPAAFTTNVMAGF